MKKKLNPVAENFLFGTCVGVFVGFILMYFFRAVQIMDMASLVLFVFIILGAVLGVLSGLERKRMQKLRREKQALDINLIKIQK